MAGRHDPACRLYPEAGVVHLQRLEQALIKKFGETLTGYCLDDAAEQVHRQAVFPDGAGLVGEGGFGEAVDLLVRLYVAPLLPDRTPLLGQNPALV